MKDFFHEITNWIDYNRYLSIGVLLGGALLFMVVGCQPTTKSPFDGQKVTDNQLQAQVQAFQAQLDAKVKSAGLSYQQTLADLQVQATSGQANAQAALDDINQKKQGIQTALAAISQLATSAAGPYAPVLGSTVGVVGVLLGLGAAADSRRKDQVILSIKSDQAAGMPPLVPA